MTSGPKGGLARSVGGALRGQQLAQESLERIARGSAVPDELFNTLMQAAKNWDLDGIRGAARLVQKQLERQGVET